MVNVREASRLDADAISRLIIPVAEIQIAADFPQQGRNELLGGMTREAIGKNLLEGYRYYVAMDDQAPCGAIGMRGYSHVYHLFVAIDRQGDGVGRRLWERARDASLAEVRLKAFTVYSSLFAEPFYYRLGFRRSGEPKTRNGVTAVPMHFTMKEEKK